MKYPFVLVYTIFFNALVLSAQDSLYTREVIKYLTSPVCKGRGYTNNGLEKAHAFIISELKKQNTHPLFTSGFSQSFFHPVNTFNGVCEVEINHTKLIPGKDYILNPNSKGLKGTFDLNKADSLHYIAQVQNKNISIVLKKKLTYTVGREESNFCEIELNKESLREEPKTVKINIKNKFIPNFESKNIAAYINGTSSSDSCIVFSAHYDHLGTMGRSTFFPGANDNTSGVSMVLNLVNYYTKHSPYYKTIFIFFAGEEAGLLGSKHFVNSKMMDLSKIKFLVNLDLLGTGDDGIMVVNGAIHEKEFNKLVQINQQKQLVKQIKKRGKAANSDHYWFAEQGVPSFFIYTMGGITAYHDVFDIEKTLPLTDYQDVFTLITEFINQL